MFEAYINDRVNRTKLSFDTIQKRISDYRDRVPKLYKMFPEDVRDKNVEKKIGPALTAAVEFYQNEIPGYNERPEEIAKAEAAAERTLDLIQEEVAGSAKIGPPPVPGNRRGGGTKRHRRQKSKTRKTWYWF